MIVNALLLPVRVGIAVCAVVVIVAAAPLLWWLDDQRRDRGSR